MKKNDHIGIFTRYSRLGASSRLRAIACCESLPGATLNHLFGEKYLRKLYATGKRPFFPAAAGMLKRFFSLFFLPRQLVIEYELLPYAPWWVEKFFLRRRRYVLDFDDAVWEKYRRIPWLRNKFRHLISHAAGVICANHFILKEVSKYNSAVVLIPTPVDLPALPSKVVKPEVFTVGWIGTPVTFECFMKPFFPVLQQLAQTTDYVLLVISDGAPPEIPGVAVRFEKWDEKTQYQLLSGCHAGIMPLDNSTFAAGKSGYKIIQYMAAGIVPVASPAGENSFLICDGENGMLAATESEWVNKLAALAADSALQRRLADAAGKKAGEFSLDVNRRKYQGFVKTRV